jgi:predicted RNA-binding protein YlqC (UPF0109 family)
MSLDQSVDYDILHTLLLNLVTEKDSLKIDRTIDEQGVLLSVTVSASDMGIVIGKGGSMATAIKTLLRAVGKSHKMNVRVQFLEPDGSIRFNNKKPNGNFNENRSDNSEPEYFEERKEVESITSLDDDLKDFVIN